MRVGDVPLITKSIATTRIQQPGSLIGFELGTRKQKPKTHGDKSFGVVYVNEIGRASMLSSAPAAFPAGSIIVREKLSQPSASVADLLAVMAKRPKGFSPKTNDWEFLIISGDGKKIEKREKAGACFECHASQKPSDFVFGEQK